LKNVAAGANPMDLKRGIDKWQAIVTGKTIKKVVQTQTKSNNRLYFQ
jgi:hypothetical protein